MLRYDYFYYTKYERYYENLNITSKLDKNHQLQQFSGVVGIILVTMLGFTIH